MRFGEYLKDRKTQVLVLWGVFSAISYIFLLLVGKGEQWAADATWIPYDGSIVISVIVLFFVLKFYGLKSFEGKVWAFITVGLALWAVAELITGIDVLLRVLDAGSLPAILTDNADYPFLAGYIVMAMGFIYKAANTPLKPDSGKAFLVLAITGIFAFGCVYRVLLPLSHTSMYTGSEKFFMSAYVVLDLFLFSLGLAIALYWGKAVSKGWYLIAVGLLSMMIADIGYTALDLSGVYFDGALIELAWIAAYLLIALAGNYQKKLHESFM